MPPSKTYFGKPAFLEHIRAHLRTTPNTPLHITDTAANFGYSEHHVRNTMRQIAQEMGMALPKSRHKLLDVEVDAIRRAYESTPEKSTINVVELAKNLHAKTGKRINPGTVRDYLLRFDKTGKKRIIIDMAGIKEYYGKKAPIKIAPDTEPSMEKTTPQALRTLIGKFGAKIPTEAEIRNLRAKRLVHSAGFLGDYTGDMSKIIVKTEVTRTEPRQREPLSEGEIRARLRNKRQALSLGKMSKAELQKVDARLRQELMRENTVTEIGVYVDAEGRVVPRNSPERAAVCLAKVSFKDPKSRTWAVLTYFGPVGQPKPV